MCYCRFARRMFIQSEVHRTAVRFPQHCRLTLTLKPNRGSGTSVGIVTRPQTGRIMVRFPAQVKDFWHTRSPIQRIPRLVVPRELKRREREADHSSQSSTEVKNARRQIHIRWGKFSQQHNYSYSFIVVLLTEFTSPYSLNTQRGWHTSDTYSSTCPKWRADRQLCLCLRAPIKQVRMCNIPWLSQHSADNFSALSDFCVIISLNV